MMTATAPSHAVLGGRVEDIAGIDPGVVAEVERETSELLSALIRIDTSNPPGDETRVAEFMAAWFRERGLEGEIAGEPADRASFVLRVDSGRPGPSLLLLAHEDVVPANAPDWSVPPFSGPTGTRSPAPPWTVPSRSFIPRSRHPGISPWWSTAGSPLPPTPTCRLRAR